MTTLILLAAAAMIMLALCPGGARRHLLKVLGVLQQHPSSTMLTLSENLLLMAFLVALGFMAMNPESRLLLMAVDAIGIDLFVLLLSLQLRHVMAQGYVGIDRMIDGWYRQIWLPGYRLTLKAARPYHHGFRRADVQNKEPSFGVTICAARR